jgi:hypothetical protein
MSATTPKLPPPSSSKSVDELTGTELAWLEENAPKTYKKLLQADRHQRRIAWTDLFAHIIGQVAGLAALSILTIISWHAFDLHYPSQGAAIICTGAVSIVAVFVTGRLTSGQK